MQLRKHETSTNASVFTRIVVENERAVLATLNVGNAALGLLFAGALLLLGGLGGLGRLFFAFAFFRRSLLRRHDLRETRHSVRQCQKKGRITRLSAPNNIFASSA